MICDPVFCTPRDSAESLKNDSDKSHIPLFYHENTDELTKCAMIPVEDPEGVQAIESLKILQKTFDMMEYAYLALAQYPKSEKYARAHIVQHASANDITLRGIHTGHAADDELTLTAHLLMNGHTPAKLERLVAELSLQPGVRAVQWYAGEKAQSD